MPQSKLINPKADPCPSTMVNLIQSSILMWRVIAPRHYTHNSWQIKCPIQVKFQPEKNDLLADFAHTLFFQSTLVKYCKSCKSKMKQKPHSTQVGSIYRGRNPKSTHLVIASDVSLETSTLFLSPHMLPGLLNISSILFIFHSKNTFQLFFPFPCASRTMMMIWGC